MRPVNMTGKTKGWPVNSPIIPDIVRWPAVISSLGFWSLVQGFFSGYSGFLPFAKTNFPKFQFDLETMDVRAALWKLLKYLFYFVTTLFVLNRRETNKGIGIEVIHFLNDGLWQMKQLEKWNKYSVKEGVCTNLECAGQHWKYCRNIVMTDLRAPKIIFKSRLAKRATLWEERRTCIKCQNKITFYRFVKLVSVDCLFRKSWIACMISKQ